MKYRNIVWDWNGTLLDDLDVGVKTLNDMLFRRGLATVTKEEYKEQFGFPVIRFYECLGFDMKQESLHDLSVDFVKTYDKYARGVTLNPEVPEVLTWIQKTGRKQFILSALREDLLRQMVQDFAIESCFDGLCGSDNICAAGKIERGRQMLKSMSILPSDTLMIGDTLHDAEVAEALGFDCILFSGGHNSGQRLASKASVIHRLKDICFCI